MLENITLLFITDLKLLKKMNKFSQFYSYLIL
jgi:hypothetical protein